jgi:cystathionine gamma-synthase
VQEIFYPKYTTHDVYQKYCVQPHGYGGLFSLVLKSDEDAVKFYDRLEIHKGPSLGTNFTLACPYTILAHYFELDWAMNYSVPKRLIRVSVGLENSDWLVKIFKETLDSL